MDVEESASPPSRAAAMNAKHSSVAKTKQTNAVSLQPLRLSTSNAPQKPLDPKKKAAHASVAAPPSCPSSALSAVPSVRPSSASPTVSVLSTASVALKRPLSSLSQPADSGMSPSTDGPAKKKAKRALPTLPAAPPSGAAVLAASPLASLLAARPTNAVVQSAGKMKKKKMRKQCADEIDDIFG